jgi:hypothetical protein
MAGMGATMEKYCGTMDAKAVSSWMEEWLSGMIKGCFSCLDDEGREKALGLCREMLDRIESAGHRQAA